MKTWGLIFIFIVLGISAHSQCGNTSLCNPNSGLNSNDNAADIEYDNIISGFHTTFAKEVTGVWKGWGDLVSNSGIDFAVSPRIIDSTTFLAMRGKILKLGYGSTGWGQFVILTDSGLFIGGGPYNKTICDIPTSTTFQRLIVNNKLDGLPVGISPLDVKMLFLSKGSITITTCSGEVYVLSNGAQLLKRGDGGATGISKMWAKVMVNATTPLSDIIVARGNANIVFALKSDGTLWTWGERCLLGNGTDTFNTNYAVQMVLPTTEGIKMIQAANELNSNSYYVLGKNKKIYALGDNASGQLGDFSTQKRLVWINCKYSNGDIIDDAVWISANEHDERHAALGFLNQKGNLYLAGDNNANMIAAYYESVNSIFFIPKGLKETDNILQVEVGGHTTIVIKQGSERYGYCGHRIAGSMGNNDSFEYYEDTINFIIPPKVSICGSRCSKPKVSSNVYSCFNEDANFYISAWDKDTVFYRLNNGALQYTVLDTTGIKNISIPSITSTQTIKLLSLSSPTQGCTLNFDIRDTVTYSVSPRIKPQFPPKLYTCNSDTINPLPPFSTNGYKGKWMPPFNADSSRIYRFFPDKNQCADTASTYLVVNKSQLKYSPLFDRRYCQGDTFKGKVITSNIMYDTLRNMASNGCDSIIKYDFQYYKPYKYDTTYSSICEGQSYNGRTTTGKYYDTMPNVPNSCYLVKTTYLTVKPRIRDTQTIMLCEGKFYKGKSLPGLYSDTFKNIGSNGCDSISFYRIQLLTKKRDTLPPTTVCEGQSYRNRTITGFFSDTFVAMPCDSIVYYQLNVKKKYRDTNTVFICPNASYNNKTAEGYYSDTILSTTSLTCDTIHTLHLRHKPLGINTVNKTICFGDTFQGNYISGVYTQTYSNQAANGCDSMYVLNLTVLPKKISTQNIQFCKGQNYQGYQSSGIYKDTFKNIGIFGCDSIRILNLTVYDTTQSFHVKVICEGEIYKNRKISGLYTDTLIGQNKYGCDSFVKFSLVVKPTIIDSFKIHICQGDNYQGKTNRGFYLDTFKNKSSLGCDSIRYLWIDVTDSIKTIFFDTLVLKGDSIQLPFSMTKGYTYLWSSINGLSCNNCNFPWLNNIQDSTTYTVSYVDTPYSCFKGDFIFRIGIFKEAIVNVPAAFTPNDDGNNDTLYVRTIGIKKVDEFKIYNRWGALLFFSQDEKNGWDGKYKEAIQNSEVYYYTIKATTQNNTIISKEGNFMLLK
jgi:gliding motility-associated-like protein